MKKKFNPIQYVIYSIMSMLLLCSCGQDDGPCTGGGINCGDHEGMYRGIIVLDSSDILLSFKDSFNQMTFKDSNGFQYNYSFDHDEGNDHWPVNYYTRGESQPCCSNKQIYYRDYIELQNESVIYKPSNGGFSASVIRGINVETEFSPNDSLIIKSKSETLGIVFNHVWFEMNLDTSYSSSKQQFHKQILLRNNSYTDVYELINTYETIANYPKGIYFSFSKGIIGYYLVNNELWVQDE